MALGCARETPSPGPGTPELVVDPPPPGSARPPAPSAAPQRANEPVLEDWILARLRAPQHPLQPLGEDTPDVGAERHGAIASGAFLVEDPTTLWLLVFRFANQDQANAARDAIVKALEPGPPHSVRTSITGAYLLAIGFGSHKPPSPEMESAQVEYLSAFAGRE
jgi:hypothetical protein